MVADYAEIGRIIPGRNDSDLKQFGSPGDYRVEQTGIERRFLALNYEGEALKAHAGVYFFGSGA